MKKKTLLESDRTKSKKVSRRDFLERSAMAGIGLMMPSCVLGSEDAREETSGTTDQNTLIAYLTRTYNTKAVAEIIRREVEGILMEVVPATPYPVDYDAIVSQVDEENKRGYAPPLQDKITDIRNYDTIFVGFPTWDMQLPPPIKSFLEKHDLSGKTVVPFNTNGGYGLGSTVQQIKSRYPDANILEAFSTRGGLERDGVYLAIKAERREEVRAEVNEWLQGIGVK